MVVPSLRPTAVLTVMSSIFKAMACSQFPDSLVEVANKCAPATKFGQKKISCYTHSLVYSPNISGHGL